MKKIFIIWIFTIFTKITIAEIPNAGFENGTNSWTGDANLTIAEETIVYYGGTKSLNCTFNSITQADCDLRGDFVTNVSASASYTVTARFLDNDPAGRANIAIEWYDNNNTLINTSYGASYTVDQTTWQQLSFTATSPAFTVKAKVGSRFYDVTAGWDGDCTIYVDDFSGSDPFPVELSSFSAFIQGNAVNLKWQTKTETNNYGFEILRSTLNDNTTWIKVGFVNGSGNSNSPKDYSFTDKSATTGKFFYRLKQIDTDGKYDYSKEVEVDLGLPKTFTLGQNYPNPFNPTTTITFTLPVESNVQIQVFTIEGVLVKSLLNERQNAGVYRIEFDASNIASGTYIYRLNAGGFIQTKKMTLTK